VSFAAIYLCVASQRVFIVFCCLFHYVISPGTFGYTLVAAVKKIEVINESRTLQSRWTEKYRIKGAVLCIICNDYPVV
jgi:hypothetical protein